MRSKRHSEEYGCLLPLVLAMGALIIAAGLSGCASPDSNRGNLGSTPAAAEVVVAGYYVAGTQTAPTIGTDESGYQAPGVDAVVTAFDQQLAALQQALGAAQEAGDTEQVQVLSAKIAAIDRVRNSIGGPSTVVTFITLADSANVTTSGTSSSESPGDNDQGGGDLSATVPVQVTQGQGNQTTEGNGSPQPEPTEPGEVDSDAGSVVGRPER